MENTALRSTQVASADINDNDKTSFIGNLRSLADKMQNDKVEDALVMYVENKTPVVDYRIMENGILHNLITHRNLFEIVKKELAKG